MRKLTAILFSDIVGFTALMGENEEFALAAITRSKDLMQPLVEKYNGIWHKDLGDGALISFDSSVSALKCAMDIQDALKNEDSFKLRIGIHQADVMHEDGDVLGDGVNIAARIEGLANPGGICISEAVLNSNRNMGGLSAKPLQAQQLKNVSIALNLFHVVRDDSTTGIIIDTDRPDRVNKIRWSITAVIVTALSIGLYFYFASGADKFTDYEIAYFHGDFAKTMELSKSARSLKDIKANYYFISSVMYVITYAESIEKDSPARQLLKYYQNLLRSNPDSPEAHFYLSMAYWNYGIFTSPSQSDSIPLLLDYAIKNGMSNVPVGAFSVQYYRSFGDRNKLKKIADRYLTDSDTPEGLSWAASTYFQSINDTVTALNLYRKALESYPNHVDSRLDLAIFYTGKGHLDSAELMLKEAYSINPESADIIRRLISNYRAQGRFDEAKEILLNAINSFGIENRRFYYNLISFYLDEDNIEEGKNLVETALDKFPKDGTLVNYQSQFTTREEWLVQEAEMMKGRKSAVWFTNFDEALTRSEEEDKPILIDFWTTWCYWCKYLDKKVYPDSAVQEKLKNYVLLKINAEQELALRDKYKIRAYPTLLVLDKTGEEIYKLEDNMQPPALIKSLESGLVEFSKREKGVLLSGNSYTKVSNSVDAQIISQNRNIPIMTIVGDKRSKWSQKLTDITLTDPGFKASATDIVYLYLDQDMDDPFLNNLPISTYPTIFFSDSEGNVIYQRRGFQPPHVLSNLVDKIKLNYKSGVKIENNINWFFNLEEAEMNATSENKYVFIAAHDPTCDPCNQMNEGTYNDPAVIQYLNDRFINVYLDDDHDSEQIRSLEIYGFPSQVVRVNGETLFRGWDYKNSEEFINWLDMDTKLKIGSLIGFDKFKQYSDELMYAKTLNRRGLYRTSNQVIEGLIEVVQELPEPYFLSGKNSLYLNQYSSAITQFKKAINLGMVDEDILSFLMLGYFAEGIPEDYITWLNEMIEITNDDKETHSVLFWIQSHTYDLLEDHKSALIAAEKAIESNSKNYQATLKLGQLLYDSENLVDAASVLLRAEELDKSDPFATFYLALIASKNGHEQEKSQYFEKVFDRSRNAAGDVNLDWLEAFSGLENYNEITSDIKESYDHMAILNPASFFPYFKLTIYDLIEGNVKEKTLININKAIELRPRDNRIMYYKVWVLHELGKKEAAAELLEELAKITTQGQIEREVSMLYIHGLIHYMNAEMEKARDYLSMAVKFREPQGLDRRIQKLAETLFFEESEIKVGVN